MDLTEVGVLSAAVVSLIGVIVWFVKTTTLQLTLGVGTLITLIGDDPALRAWLHRKDKRE
jgi:hypothetical protein